jgi:hypothetical protein
MIALFAAAHRFPLGDATYYSVVVWAFFNVAMNGLFVYKNLSYMHAQKRAGVLDGRVHYSAFMAWRFKTIGTLAGYVCLVAIGMLFARQQPEVTAWMNQAFPSHVHLATKSGSGIAAADSDRAQ